MPGCLWGHDPHVHGRYLSVRQLPVSGANLCGGGDQLPALCQGRGAGSQSADHGCRISSAAAAPDHIVLREGDSDTDSVCAVFYAGRGMSALQYGLGFFCVVSFSWIDASFRQNSVVLSGHADVFLRGDAVLYQPCLLGNLPSSSASGGGSGTFLKRDLCSASGSRRPGLPVKRDLCGAAAADDGLSALLRQESWQAG